MDVDVFQSLKVKYCSIMIQQIMKAIDAHKPIPKVSISDAMKLLIICWEDVTKETIQMFCKNLHFSRKSNPGLDSSR